MWWPDAYDALGAEDHCDARRLRRSRHRAHGLLKKARLRRRHHRPRPAIAGDKALGKAEDQRALAAGFSDGGNSGLDRGFAGCGDGEVGEGDAESMQRGAPYPLRTHHTQNRSGVSE